jgi:hypothetical protein
VGAPFAEERNSFVVQQIPMLQAPPSNANPQANWKDQLKPSKEKSIDENAKASNSAGSISSEALSSKVPHSTTGGMWNVLTMFGG